MSDIGALIAFYASAAIVFVLLWLLILKPYDLLRLRWKDWRITRRARRYDALSPEEQDAHRRQTLERYKAQRAAEDASSNPSGT